MLASAVYSANSELRTTDLEKRATHATSLPRLDSFVSRRQRSLNEGYHKKEQVLENNALASHRTR